MPKAVCPVTRGEFLEKAERLVVKIGDDEMKLTPKQFAASDKGSSLGWGYQGSVSVQVNGKWVDAQVGLNITIKGSKELPPIE